VFVGILQSRRLRDIGILPRRVRLSPPATSPTYLSLEWQVADSNMERDHIREKPITDDLRQRFGLKRGIEYQKLILTSENSPLPDRSDYGCPRDLGKEFQGIDAERPRDYQQFDDIDAPLTTLVFRYEALRLAEPCGRFLLRDIRPSPGSGQTRADHFVLLGLNPQRRCLGHAIRQTS
jgi:hypothetical protein